MEADMGRDVHAPIECKEDDLLGRSALAERIYSRLCSDECPQAIGIYGGWGTGKTSLLKLLMKQREFSKNDSLQIEYIDAWQYEESGDLFVPIIVKLMAQRATINPDVATYLKRVSLSILYMGTDMALRKFSGLGLEDVKKYKADIEENEINHVTQLMWENYTDKVAETNRAWADLVEHINKDKCTSKIVFLIDNLDRCSPENTIKLLESIKNFLNISGCVWVFAMDSDVVGSYIDHKYENIVMDGNSYLDKIIPEQYHLSLSPTLDSDKIIDLLNFSAESEKGLPFRIDEKKIPQIPKILVPRRLIKSAKKFSEYYQDPAVGVSPDMVLSLVLLYHTWPAFYQRLTSASEEHIRGIFNHFFETVRASSGQRIQIPLAEKFSKDEELVYFIRTAFADYRNGKAEDLLDEILVAVKELRQIGLP
jgi:hypothetical protein